MERQQVLLEAIRDTVGPEMILNAPALFGAAKGSAWTDLPRESLPALVELFGKAADAKVKNLRIVPSRYPSFMTAAWITQIRRDVAALLPGTPDPARSSYPRPVATPKPDAEAHAEADAEADRIAHAHAHARVEFGAHSRADPRAYPGADARAHAGADSSATRSDARRTLAAGTRCATAPVVTAKVARCPRPPCRAPHDTTRAAAKRFGTVEVAARTARGRFLSRLPRCRGREPAQSEARLTLSTGSLRGRGPPGWHRPHRAGSRSPPTSRRWSASGARSGTGSPGP